MEPADLDKLIKAKLGQENQAHQKEIQEAKPFVWSAIQREISPSSRIGWGYVAAAVIMLFITFGFIFLSLQKRHKQEMAVLSEQVDDLKQNYTQQVSSTNLKDQQLSELLEEIHKLKYKLEEIQHEQPTDVGRERIVYRTDTVYVREVEYVIITEPATVMNEVRQNQEESQDEAMHAQNTVVERAIYPGYNKYAADQKTEKVRVRFGNLRAKSN
jgi:hypothetical protein